MHICGLENLHILSHVALFQVDCISLHIHISTDKYNNNNNYYKIELAIYISVSINENEHTQSSHLINYILYNADITTDYVENYKYTLYFK